MTVFIDANVLVYAMIDTPFSEPCREILTAIARGQLDAATSVLAAEEAWHAERRAPLGIPAGSIMTAIGLFDNVLACDVEVVEDAMRMTTLPDSLGTADRIHLATCRANGIDTIVSADDAFDTVAWLTRVRPDAAGVAALLG